MTIRQGLLALLDRAPMHGYQLRQEFETATGSTWPLNIGQVYTTLGRLERDGLVEVGAGDSAGDDDQTRVYSLTGAGRAEVHDWFTSPVATEAPPRNELAIKIALAAVTPGVDVATVLQVQRRATMLALQSFTRARERAGSDLPWLLVADSLIFAAEAEIRWLDHCELRVARAVTPPTPTPTPVTVIEAEEARR